MAFYSFIVKADLHLEISFHGFRYSNCTLGYKQQDAEPSFKQLVYKKETSVWHDVPPAGRWVEWAEVVLGSGVQVREQRGGNDWRQAVLSAVRL